LTIRDENDQRFMRRALRLAQRGRGRTRPNPIVGAVVVRAGRIVGEGWHTAAGRPHAEALALRAAGARARGATLYATLEPCAHTGRTPPCVDAILAAGIARCVVAMKDPHRIVNGRGLRKLRLGGVRVTLGVCAKEANAMLAGYALVQRERRPRVTWKLGVTLDGKVADARGRSRWITSRASRRMAHVMRSRADAIVIGAGTARADDPRLTVRLGAARLQPLRIVCDTRLALPLTLRLFRELAVGTVVACGRRASAAKRRTLEARGVEVWPVALENGRVSPRAVARKLAAAGCHDVLLECGPEMGAAWLKSRAIDELALFVAPRVLGGEARGWPGALGMLALDRAIGGRWLEARTIGDDALLRVEVRP
jgi:diaminohydroxyphosphoribosylaminopyrimidine deaminase / 5-amino-6-(5-phosphoribosylamino)uracil reductase